MKKLLPVLFPLMAIVVAGAAGVALRSNTTGEKEEAQVEPQAAEPEPVLKGEPPEPIEASASPHPTWGSLESALGFYRWLQAATVKDLEKRYLEIKEHREGLNPSYLAAILARWAEVDPVSFAEKAGTGWNNKRALLAARLSKEGEAGLTKTPKDMFSLAGQYLAARHSQFDLEKAREQEVSIKWYVLMWLRRGLSADELLADVSKLDADIVRGIASYYSLQAEPGRSGLLIQFLRQLEGTSLEEGAREAVQKSLGGWVRTPLANLKLMTALGLEWKSSNSQLHISDFFHRALSESPQGTVDWLMTLAPEDREKAMKNIFSSSWSGGTGTRGWMDLFAELPKEELPSYLKLGSYLDKELRVRPRATLRWLDETMEQQHWAAGDVRYARDQIRKQAAQIGKTLGMEGTERAMEVVNSIQNEEVRNEVLAGIVETSIEGDPERAGELMKGLVDPALSRLQNALFRRELRGLGVEEIQQSLSNLEDDQRPQYVRSVLRDGNLAIEDRAKLLDHFSEQDQSLRSESRSLAIVWANQDPAGAAEWLSSHPELPRAERNAKTLAQIWVKRDIHAAATWVLGLEEGEARDRAAAHVVEQANEREPHSALEWAASISDQGMRMKNLREALLQVDRFATEQGEAQEALEKLSLSSEEKQELQELLAGE